MWVYPTWEKDCYTKNCLTVAPVELMARYVREDSVHLWINKYLWDDWDRDSLQKLGQDSTNWPRTSELSHHLLLSFYTGLPLGAPVRNTYRGSHGMRYDGSDVPCWNLDHWQTKKCVLMHCWHFSQKKKSLAE